VSAAMLHRACIAGEKKNELILGGRVIEKKTNNNVTNDSMTYVYKMLSLKEF
jgi:hypothetical protein